MGVVRFLERKWVIQFFGVALIVSPFVNIFVQFLFLNTKTGISWRHVSISAYLLSGSFTNYALAVASIVIGTIMLRGSAKAWQAVLALVACHLVVQVMNYKTWQGSLSWAAFALNVSVFLFIADQLVWRVKTKEELLAEATSSLRPLPERNFTLGLGSRPVEKILHLKSYRKIFFSFDSDKPWGRLMTLTSHQLIVNCFTKAPESIEHKTVQINFAKNLVIDIKFDRKESNLYYFTPLDMTPEKVKELNQWLKKIAI